MFLKTIFLLFALYSSVVFCQITTTADLSSIQAEHHRQVRNMLAKRKTITYFCDVCHYFSCTTGSCFTGIDGYVGCCTASSCLGRSHCIDHTPDFSTSCDYSTGGCLYCSNSNTPRCVTEIVSSYYSLFCGAALPTPSANVVTVTTSVFSTMSGSTSTSSDSTSTTSDDSSTSSENLVTVHTTKTVTAMTTTPSIISSSSETTSSSTVAAPASNSQHLTSETSTSDDILSTTLSSTTQAQTTSTAIGSAASDSLSNSRGMIIGVVIGSAGGAILLFILAFVLWKYFAQYRAAAATRSQREKRRNTSSGYSLGTRDDDLTRQSDIGGPVNSAGVVGSSYPVELDNTVAEKTASEGKQEPLMYRCVNPDSVEGQPSSWTISPVSGVVEVAGDVPMGNSSTVSSMTSPAPFNSSLWQRSLSGGVGAHRPNSQYIAYSPPPRAELEGNEGMRSKNNDKRLERFNRGTRRHEIDEQA